MRRNGKGHHAMSNSGNIRTIGSRIPIAAALAIALACAGGLAGCSSESTAGSAAGSSSSESAASTATTTFACEMCDVLGSEELQLSITEGESDAELEDGLYAVLSNSSTEVNFVCLYDSDGILRGEIPSINGRSYRLIFEQVGDFTVHGGQHGVTYGGTDGLEDGQSYVYLFDNNIGTSSTSDFDYASIGLTNTGATSDDYSSYYYKYLVDENEGTFELVDSIEAPYSGFVSSVQEIGSNVVIDSGNASIFGEYDEDGVLIRQFSMDIDLIYRAYKYDL